MKKGYTLIELIIVIAMIAILNSVVLINAKLYKSMSCKISSKACSNNILNFIANSRQYCRKNNVEGRIEFNILDNEANFIVGLNSKIKLKFEDGNELVRIDTPRNDNIIKIKKDGVIDAGSVEYGDGSGKPHTIKIRVGSVQAYIEK